MKGVLFTRRSPPEWGAYCTPILKQGKPLAFAATVDTFGCLNFSAKPPPPVQRGRGFVTVYEGDRIVWQGHEEDVPEEYR